MLRNIFSHMINFRVFPLGSFYLFFSTCNVPPCLLEQDGKVVPGSYFFVSNLYFRWCKVPIGRLSSSSSQIMGLSMGSSGAR